MAKDDIDLNDDDLEGLDLDFDMSDPFNVKDDRNPSTKVMDTALETITDKDNLAKSARTIATNALPKGFTVAMQDGESALSEARNIYDKTTKELKEPINAFKSAVNQNIDKMSFIPEAFRNKIKEATKSESSGAVGKDSVENIAIEASIKGIFDNQQSVEAVKLAAQTKLDGRKGELEDARFKASSDIFRSINSAVSRSAAYKEQIESQYQRKMLELSHRQFYAMRELVQTTKSASADTISNLRAISKNTGLPEFVKLRGAENYVQLTRERLIGKANEKIGSSISGYGKKLLGNVQDKVSGFSAQVGEGLNSAADAINAISDVSDMDERSKEEKVSGLATSAAMGYASKKLGVKLGEYLAKNPTMMRYSNQLLYLSENAPQVFNELASRSTDNVVLQTLQDLLPTLSGDNEQVIHNLAENATEASIFDEITRRSIVEIIPGYLSRILKTTTDLVTGRSNDRLVYSADKEDFETITSAKESLKNRIFKTGDASRSMNSSIDIIDVLDPEGKLKPKEKMAATEFLNRQANAGKLFDIKDLMKLDSDSFDGAEHFAEIIRSQYDNDTTTFKLAENNLRLSRLFRESGNGYGNIEEELGKLNATGNKDVARQLGLIGKDGDRDVIDMDRKRQLFSESAFTDKKLSDRLLKSTKVDLSDKEEVTLTYKEKIEKARQDKARAELERLTRKVSKASSVDDYNIGGIKERVTEIGEVQIDFGEFDETLRDLPKQTKDLFFEEIEGIYGIPVHVLSGMSKDKPTMTPDNPMFEMVRDNLLEINEKLANLKITIGEGGEPKASTGTASSLLKKGRSIFGGGMNLLTGYYSTLGRGLGKAKDIGTSILGRVQDKVADTKKRLKDITWDIYIPGIDSPRLTFKSLLDGEYYDSVTGEVLKRFSDIENPVMDKDGNIILSMEDIKAGLTNRFGKKITLPKLDTSGIVSRLKSAMTTANTFQMNLIKRVTGTGGEILSAAKAFLNRASDVYVKGEKSPRLLGRLLDAGQYFSSVTGKPIRSISEIDGDVLDADGNVVLTVNESKLGLVDIFGNKLTGLNMLDKLKMPSELFIRKGMDIARGSIETGKNIFSSITGAIGGLFGNLTSRTEGVSSEALPVIEMIYQHMQAKWPVEGQTPYVRGEYDPSVATTKIKEAFTEFAEKAKSATEKFKGDVKDKEPDVKAYMKESMDKLTAAVRKYSSDSDLDVNADIDPNDEKELSKSGLKDVMASILRTLSPKEVDGDLDGDGLRDGGFRSQMKKQREKLKDKLLGDKVPKDGKEDKKSSGSSLGFIASIIAGIGGKITDSIGSLGGILGGIKTFLTGKLFSGLLGGGDSVADLAGGKKGGLLRRGAGMLGRGIKSAGGLAVRGIAAGAGLLAKGVGAAVAGAPLLAGAAVVGGLAYGGYKAYKYFSNRSTPEGVEAMRFLQYGIDINDKNAVANIRVLEDAVSDEIKWKGNQPTLTKTVQEFTEEFSEDFGVDQTDPDALYQWGTWFAKRFIPVYMTHLSTAKKLDIADEIDDIEDDMPDELRNKFIKMAVLPKQYGDSRPESVNASPWPATPLTDNRSALNEMVTQSLGDVKPDSIKKRKEDEKAAIPPSVAADIDVDDSESLTKKETSKVLKEREEADKKRTEEVKTAVTEAIKANVPVESDSRNDGSVEMLGQQKRSSDTLSRIENQSAMAYNQRERSIRIQAETSRDVKKILEAILYKQDSSGQAKPQASTPTAPSRPDSSASIDVKIPIDTRKSAS